ncbi:hypothetical protein AK830_g947 [Neonectria ditissima]|uniref:FAD-binding FR-type domain-containing protein n=1 Tax=Neonectria ditissima TaxID=78410 RepID=A0A0P7BNV2_9HYPO|nr:hypothetical protein AK830_g947 [Neonectria ditissima]
MTAANITLAVFFGLRNTPMRQLTTETYNRLNFLHRIVGYTAIAQVLLHATLYLTRFVSQNRWRVVLERPNLEGIISSVGMIILLAGIIRHQNYEVFYVSHVLGAVVTILFAALHRPFWLERLPIIMVIAATMWGFDRLLRGACLLSNLYNNTATLYPLPDGGVRLVLKNAPASFSPGLHCFVWIPSIKPFETHPFTIVSNTSSGLELVLKTHAGFTKDLYKHTISDPGRAIKASVEGPYGSLPDLQHFERIIFIAGGSGAAFTFGLANKLLSQIEPGSPQLVDFIWTVRKKENLTWFISHLDELRSHPSRINVVLHVTGESFVNTPVPCTSSPGSSTPLLLASRDFTSQISRDEPTEFLQRLLKTRLDSPGEEENDPLRDETFESMDLDNRFDVRYKRMRVCKVIHETVESVGTNQRLLIATCGPKSLIADVMNTAGECISSDGPSIEVHCESFDL